MSDTQKLASMRPRFGLRGNLLVALIFWMFMQIASMRPRFGLRGNHGHAFAPAPVPLLQGDRAFDCAEMRRRSCHGRQRSLLQGDRAFDCAEIRGVSIQSWPILCFNETALLIARKGVAPPSHTIKTQMLQGDRAFDCAEIQTFERQLKINEYASMRPRFGLRGNRPTSEGRRNTRMSFNETALLIARK